MFFHAKKIRVVFIWQRPRHSQLLLSSNATVVPRKGRYWLSIFKVVDNAIDLLADCWVLAALCKIRHLLSTHLTVDLPLDSSGWLQFSPVSDIDVKPKIVRWYIMGLELAFHFLKYKYFINR